MTQPNQGSAWVDKNWQILSFSKLADHGHFDRTLSAAEVRDYDGETQQDKLAAEQLDRETLSRDPKSLFSFAAGKKTGNCWHAIFEHMDFTRPATHRQLVEDWAGRFRLISEADENSAGPASFLLLDPDGNPILVDQHV